VSARAAARPACSSKYEYEEEVYLSLDGSATVYVNSSLAALNALRGTTFDLSPGGARRHHRDPRVLLEPRDARDPRQPVAPQQPSIRPRPSRRRRRAQARRVAPFAWSKYEFTPRRRSLHLLQTVGDAAKAGRRRGWNGREIVAFRLHLPSKIRYHNTRPSPPRQHPGVGAVARRSDARQAAACSRRRMDPQSILYARSGCSVRRSSASAAFVVVIWWVMRRAAKAGANRVIG
jgi:hypothetical protein